MPSKLPKAWLRIDPNLGFTHPDPGAFVKMLSYANAQPMRGRFKDWPLVIAVLGRQAAEMLCARGELVPIEDGCWYVAGWDERQERPDRGRLSRTNTATRRAAGIHGPAVAGAAVPTRNHSWITSSRGFVVAPDTEDNLRVLCGPCNRSKGAN